MKTCARIVTIILIAVLVFGVRDLSGQSDEHGETSDEVLVLIRELGDENYRTREHAHAELKNMGIEVYFDLQDAAENPDPEIAERAKQLLSLLQMKWISAQDDPRVYEIMQQYADANRVTKYGIIQSLSDTDDFSKGEGVGALCRIVLYEQSQEIRFVAAKEIIAATPITPFFTDKWFLDAKEELEQARRKGNRLRQFVFEFISLREDVQKFSDEQREKETPEPPPEKLKKRLEKWTDQLDGFMKDKSFSGEYGESDSEILFYYALADLQFGLGDEKGLETTLETISKLSMANVETKHRLPNGVIDQNSIMVNGRAVGLVAHLEAGIRLSRQNRLKWAENEFEFIASFDGYFKWDSKYQLANIAYERNDFEKAGEILQEIVDAFEKEEARDFDFIGMSKERVESQMLLFKATVAFDKKDFDSARKMIDRSVNLDPSNVDALILCHKLPNKDEAFETKTENLIKRAIANYRIDDSSPELIYNQLAWLLANTDRETERAVKLSLTSLEKNPEYPVYLDTLAHAYFANKQYKEAIETQEKACKYCPEVLLFKAKLEEFRGQGNR